MDINLLVKLTSRAWSLPILALMHAGVPGRQAALLTASGAGRTAFAQSLAHLVDLGLVERNPGYGHPLRPEYRLTGQGIVAAAMADRVKGVAPAVSQAALLRRAWTLPVLVTVQQPRYFSEMKRMLTPVTDRALSQSLKQLQGLDWVHRRVDTDVGPPRPLYQAANVGAFIGLSVQGA